MNIDVEKLIELRETVALPYVDEFFEGYIGGFDIDYDFYFTEYYSQVLNSYNQTEEICKVAILIAKQYLDQLKKEIDAPNVSDDELLVYSAWHVAKRIKHEFDKRKAYNQAEEYAYSDEMVEKYGTKNRAWNKGYDRYMSDNGTSGYAFLDYIASMYSEELENQQQSM